MNTTPKFYIQKHPIRGESFGVKELGEDFSAHYVSFKGLLENGEIKNIYTEDFTESKFPRIYIPAQNDLTYQATEVTLTLLWESNTDYEVQNDEQSFYDYIKGTLIEYHDTFRANRFWELILIAAPTLVGEKLYGGQQYREVSYKFRNIAGCSFKQSMIGSVNTDNFREPDDFSNSYLLLEDNGLIEL